MLFLHHEKLAYYLDLVSNNGDKNENFNIINDFEDDEQLKNKGSIILFNNDK